jgi:predicted ATPase
MVRNSSVVKILLLGDFRVDYGHRAIKLPTKQTRLTLAYLALYRDKPIRREKLASLFWSRRLSVDLPRNDYASDQDDANIEKNVRASLRTALSAIRRELGNDIFLEDRDSIQINPERMLWIDALEFRKHVEEFLAHSFAGPQPVEMDLYRGDLLAGFEDDPEDPWILPERQALRELYQDALLRLTQFARSKGDYEIAIAHAEQVLALEPYNEEAYEQIMFCHFMQGRKSLALDNYRKLERALQNEFGKTEYAKPSLETKNLYTRIKQAKSRMVVAPSLLTNLPTPLTPFIGRKQETETLERLLVPSTPETKQEEIQPPPTRLITLTGSGGCGKTRLAIHVATLVLEQYNDGVWWIELEGLDREHGLVPQAIAKVLSVREQANRDLNEQLVDYLRGKQLLLVLDNCEHLAAACSRICQQLLSACPYLHILTTSREVLRIKGEFAFYVPPFAFPPENAQSTLEMIMRYEAVRFFLDRALVERPTFTLTEKNASCVAQISRQLDGIPLAIELAAARMKTLTVEYISDHLNDRFSLLSRGFRVLPRHQTLAAAIDWSYNLLDTSEQHLLCELSVFAGWFTLEAIESVCQGKDGAQARENLDSLIDKSLVRLEIEPSGDPRYRLLDTIREYAHKRLAMAEEEANATYARMANYYLRFAQQHRKDFITLERDWDNISAGMRVAYGQELWQDVIEYGYALTETCFARGFFAEARRIYPWVCEAAEKLEEQEAYIASTINWGRAYIEQGFYPEAKEILTRLLRICEQAADENGAANAKLHLARVEIEQSNYDLAEKLLAECHRIREKRGDRVELAEVMLGQSRIHYRLFRYDQAAELAERALQILKTLPPSSQVIAALRRLALIARVQKDLDRAERYCREAIAFCEQLQDRVELASALFALGQLYQSRGDLEQARRYLEQSRDLTRITGDPKSEAYVLDFLGSVYAELKMYEPAYAAGKTSLDTLRQLRDDDGIVFACLRLGKTLAAMHRAEEAHRLWAEALPTADRLQHPRAQELRQLLETVAPNSSSQ